MLLRLDRHVSRLLVTSQRGENGKRRRQQKAGPIVLHHRKLLRQLLLLTSQLQKPNYPKRLGTSRQLCGPKELPADDQTLNPLLLFEMKVQVERHRLNGVQVHDVMMPGVTVPQQTGPRLALRDCVAVPVETNHPQKDPSRMGLVRQRSRLPASMSPCT